MPSPRARSIVILTGAGISRESGLHTFRDPDGIWATVRIEDVATPEAFARDPERVHQFYNERRRQLRDGSIQPNAAHLALVRLEQNWPGEFLLVTQNVDDLHARSGSRQLLPMHGELLRAKCGYCDGAWTWTEDLEPATPCPACGRAGGLRPDVVWFGEMPYALDRIFAHLRRCDLFLAIGTSGQVYPAADFVSEAAAHGAHTVALNLEPPHNNSRFAAHQHGPATVTVPAYVEQLLAPA